MCHSSNFSGSFDDWLITSGGRNELLSYWWLGFFFCLSKLSQPEARCLAITRSLNWNWGKVKVLVFLHWYCVP